MSPSTREGTSAMRRRNIGRLARIMGVFSALAGVANLVLAGITGAWQYLAGAAIFAGNLVVIWVISRLVASGSRVGDNVREGISIHEGTSATDPSTIALVPLGVLVLMFAAPLVFISATSLLWEGVALPLALIVFGICLLFGLLLLPPGQRGLPWLLGVLAGLLIWVTRSTPLPWERFDVRGYGITTGLSYVLIAAVLGLMIWQMLLAYRQLMAIRSRLVVTFIAVVVVVALAVSVTSILLGVNTTQQRTFDELETAVILKAQAVNTWLDQLRFSLESLVVEEYEVQRAQSVLLRSLSEEFQTLAAQELRVRFGTVIKRTGWFTEIFLIDMNGEIVLSTNRDAEGRIVRDAAYFQEGLDTLYVDPPRFDPLVDGITVVLARPLQIGRTTYGLVAARTGMGQLNTIARTGKLGDTGATHFVNTDRVLLTGPSVAGGYVPVQSQAIRTAFDRPIGIRREVYTNHRGVNVSGAYTWLPRLRVALMIEQDQAEVLSGAVLTSIANGGVALLSTFVAVLIAVWFANTLATPLSELADTATQVAQGDLDLEAAVVRDDEIGAVAQAFNMMTGQLRDLIGTLETRVEERTRGLQALAEVSRATTSVLDPDQLLSQVVNLAQERFGLYYVGLFLLDEAEENAVLRAGTGDAGREMLAQGWSLAVGGGSMIGRCVATGTAVIKQQAGDEVVRFENPWLPETRSELALPLRYGGGTIGAMTVQSVVPRAFEETDIAVLQNLADQVAVAVQNARLFAETQAALDRVRRAQRRYERQAWSAYLNARAIRGYDRRGSVVEPLRQDAPQGVDPEVLRTALASGEPAEGDGHVLVPIVQSGQVIGTLGVERDADAGWSDEDMALVQSLAEQLALAAENQRLLDVSQRREAAERLTREVTTRMRQPVDVEEVLRTAADEIRKALDCDWVRVRMAAAEQDGRTGSNGNGRRNGGDRGDGDVG